MKVRRVCGSSDGYAAGANGFGRGVSALDGGDYGFRDATISSCLSGLFLYPPEIREEPLFMPADY